ncbi:hypothetical protein FHS20_004252 [Phyllobacterium endophyticum]|nr:hypothetical protein [Phyllobacterium endophyticum]
MGQLVLRLVPFQILNELLKPKTSSDHTVVASIPASSAAYTNAARASSAEAFPAIASVSTSRATCLLGPVSPGQCSSMKANAASTVFSSRLS